MLLAVLLLQATFQSPRVVESSGVAASRAYPGVLWTHNDSGDGPYLYATTLDGRDLGWLLVPGAEAIDWEDIALGPCPAAFAERASGRKTPRRARSDNARARWAGRRRRARRPRRPQGSNARDRAWHSRPRGTAPWTDSRSPPRGRRSSATPFPVWPSRESETVVRPRSAGAAWRHGDRRADTVPAR